MSKPKQTTTSTSKSKLKNLKQTDGRVDSLKELNEEKTQPRTLAQFFGESIAGKYKTTDESEYINFLKNLNKSDLQAHAIKCGLVPKDDRQRLVISLVKEFRRTVASYKPLPVLKQDNKKITPEIMRILAQGR